VTWALQDFDGKDLCMGKHILSLRGALFILDCNLANAMEDSFYSRWKMVRIDLHYTSVLLNPYFLHNKEFAYKKVLQKLCPLEIYPNVKQDFLAFYHKLELFHNMLDLMHSVQDAFRCAFISRW
jgi:hypothetical protein